MPDRDMLHVSVGKDGWRDVASRTPLRRELGLDPRPPDESLDPLVKTKAK